MVPVALAALARIDSASADKTVEGVIRRFTSAPRGEVDGAVLEDGTVIHWPPHREDRFAKIASKGDRVRVTGRMETGPEGDSHLEVQNLTNLRTNRSGVNDGPPPPDRRRAGPDRSSDREQRLRALEEQVEQLRREIARLAVRNDGPDDVSFSRDAQRSAGVSRAPLRVAAKRDIITERLY